VVLCGRLSWLYPSVFDLRPSRALVIMQVLCQCVVPELDNSCTGLFLFFNFLRTKSMLVHGTVVFCCLSILGSGSAPLLVLSSPSDCKVIQIGVTDVKL